MLLLLLDHSYMFAVTWQNHKKTFLRLAIATTLETEYTQQLCD